MKMEYFYKFDDIINDNIQNIYNTLYILKLYLVI